MPIICDYIFNSHSTRNNAKSRDISHIRRWLTPVIRYLPHLVSSALGSAPSRAGRRRRCTEALCGRRVSCAGCRRSPARESPPSAWVRRPGLPAAADRRADGHFLRGQRPPRLRGVRRGAAAGIRGSQLPAGTADALLDSRMFTDVDLLRFTSSMVRGVCIVVDFSLNDHANMFDFLWS